MDTMLLSGKMNKFWKWIIVMIANTLNILKTTELYTSKAEFYGMCRIFQLKKQKINSF